MNNQVKLELNREQVIEFLKIARPDLTEDAWKDADVITVLQWALPTYQKWTNHGTYYDSDPVPTIKPGDKVNYHDFQFSNLRAAVVDHLRVHSFGTYAVLRYDGELYTVPLSNVEVVE